jgi:hypothetical protein
VADPASLRLPDLETSRLLAGTRFAGKEDTSAKRNLGLVLSHMIGWGRIVFLDDDILVGDPGHLRQAAGLLDTHNAVGLSVVGYPDNSVVCHAYRAVGGFQQSFIGGGALGAGRGAIAQPLVLPRYLQRGLVLSARRRERAATPRSLG